MKGCCSVVHALPNGQKFRIANKGRSCMTRGDAGKVASEIRRKALQGGTVRVQCGRKMPPAGK